MRLRNRGRNLGLDDTINLQRLASAFEKIAAAMEESNRIERERLTHEFPEKKPAKPAEVIDPNEDRKQLLSDRPTDKWLEETEEALPQSRFAKRLDEARELKERQSKGRSTAPVSKTQ